MNFTVRHRDPGRAITDRPAYRAWAEWATSVRPEPKSATRTASVAAVARMRARVMAGQPVDPALLMAIAGDRDGREWLDALARVARLTPYRAVAAPRLRAWQAWRATCR